MAGETSFWDSPGFAALINGALALWQSKQNGKTPNSYIIPQSPEEKWITDAKKDLYGNASGFVNSYLGGLGNLQPDFKMNTGDVGNPSFMGGIKVPSFNFKAGTPTPAAPTPPSGGGPDDPRGGIPKDPNAPDKPTPPTPDGQPDPFPPGYTGPQGVGGEDSPDFKRLLDAAMKYGPGVLGQFFGGPLGSIAAAVFKKLTGSSPTPGTDLPGGTPDTTPTLGSIPSNWHPRSNPDLGINHDQGTLGDIFQHPTDATGAQGTYDFWNGLMNGGGQIAPDFFSMHVNPNVGRKK